MTTKVAEGKPAPDFELPASNGATVSLKHYRGSKVALFFYPRNFTGGCTTEVCSFGWRHAALAKAGAVVLGVSTDDLASHAKFIEKYKLPYLLLSDTGHHAAEKYGAWGEKSMYGKKFMGIKRSTFLIDAAGNVEKIWAKVSPKDHADEVLAAILRK